MTSRQPVIAALFDVDGTLYGAQFGRGLLRYVSEHDRKHLAWAYYASLLPGYLLNKTGLAPDGFFLESVIKHLASLLRGMNNEQLDEALDWVVNQYLLPTKYSEVLDRFSAHLQQDHYVLLVSAQFSRSLSKIGRILGVQDVIGTGLEIRNGRATGRIRPPVLTGIAKARFVQEFFRKADRVVDWEKSWAYSDSITDLEMLKLAGNPVAVYPDEKLGQLAQAKGWEIIQESESAKRETDGKA